MRVAQPLRPRKIRNAVARRRFERALAATPLASSPPVVHLGTDYGGWYVPAAGIEPDWLCYTVGAGADISFDLALIEHYGCRVRCFEPSESFHESLYAAAERHERLTFHPFAVAPEDAPVELYVAADPTHGALSALDLQRTGRALEVLGRSLPSLMRELGDDRIDLLKLDVEGLEYDVLDRLDLVSLGVRVFCVELHHTASVGRARGLIEDLERRGYAAVHRKPPTSFTFVRADWDPPATARFADEPAQERR